MPLSLALGSALNYLVIDRQDEAKNLSNILKDKGIQKDVIVLENFPEISQSSEKNLSNIRRSLEKEGNHVFDIIDFDRRIPNLEKSLRFLTEGKIVCKNLEFMQKIRNKNLNGIRHIGMNFFNNENFLFFSQLNV